MARSWPADRGRPSSSAATPPPAGPVPPRSLHFATLAASQAGELSPGHAGSARAAPSAENALPFTPRQVGGSLSPPARATRLLVARARLQSPGYLCSYETEARRPSAAGGRGPQPNLPPGSPPRRQVLSEEVDGRESTFGGCPAGRTLRPVEPGPVARDPTAGPAPAWPREDSGKTPELLWKEHRRHLGTSALRVPGPWPVVCHQPPLGTQPRPGPRSPQLCKEPLRQWLRWTPPRVTRRTLSEMLPVDFGRRTCQRVRGTGHRIPGASGPVQLSAEQTRKPLNSHL